MKISSVILIALVIASMALGQILFKLVADRLKDIDIATGAGIGRALSEPLLWPALLLYAVTTVLWIAVLTKVNLSHAYPIVVATTILIVSLAGIVLFRESLSSAGLIGSGLILAGLLVKTFSA